MNWMKSLAVSEFAAEGAVELVLDVEFVELVAVPSAEAREFIELIVQPFGTGSRGNVKI
jgi:hypothetical protein